MSQVFKEQDLQGAGFYGVNLGGAVFDGVNLGEARIRDANLADVSIADANLKGVRISGANLADVLIEHANIKGMTVEGFRVDELIDAERDRLDETRHRLRIADLTDPAAVGVVMAELGQLRDAFKAALRAAGHDALCRRPGEGRWSAIEHVRHLVFAEQLYTDRWILANDEPWYGLGLLPAFLEHRPEYADVGSTPTDDLKAILAEWDEIHTRTLSFVSTVTPEQLARDTSKIDFGQGTVGRILQGLAHHDLHHIRKAEALLTVAT